MSRTYAIADLHGRYDLLDAALAKIEAREPGKVVFLGDYVDRGPQSRRIIERLMAGPPAGWRWVCLQGNHEAMMLACISDPSEIRWWIGNGGGQTLISYGHPTRGKADVSVVPVEHLRWLRDLPMLHYDLHRVFVHAGVDPTRGLDDQIEARLQWFLYPDGLDMGHGDRHVVHGHHQFEDGPILLKNRSDLDVFAWRTGRIVVGVFDDEKPGGPVEIIEVVGVPAYEAA